MEKFIINGGKKLTGEIAVSGSKNVALKALVAATLTDEEVVIENIPLIADFFTIVEIIEQLGGKVTITDHTARVHTPSFQSHKIPLDVAARSRASSMFIGPLLLRNKEAIIPNPGGCRLGARPIDRTIDGLVKMGAVISYNSDDGYFYATTDGLTGTTYTFEKTTHTGTETLIIAATLAKGKTVLENAAVEPEIDELIDLLTAMGARIMRIAPRTIEIHGVEHLHGTTFRIDSDRNEVVTFAIAAILTQGDIFINDIKRADIHEFLEKLDEVGGGYEEKNDGIRFFYKGKLSATEVTTVPYPGFMTDWQAPWAVLMTKAEGTSMIHETVFENRFGYVPELRKMGAHIDLFNPPVADPESFYNFNSEDDSSEYFHAVRIHGATTLHNAVVTISDLRAGATLVLAALAAHGESSVFDVEHLDRGYERFEERLKSLGADVKRKEVG